MNSATDRSTKLSDLGEETDGSSRPDDRALNFNHFQERTAHLIKMRIKGIWDEYSIKSGKSQKELAAEMGLSPGALSKLLINEKSHPWTIEKMLLFSRVCGVPFASMLGDAARGVVDLFPSNDTSDSDTDFDLLKISYDRVREYYSSRNISISIPRLEKLAGLVALRAETSKIRTDEFFDQTITAVLAEEAAGRDS